MQRFQPSKAQSENAALFAANTLPIIGAIREHLIEVPGRMRLGPHRPQTSGDHRSEHRHPTSDRFVGDVDAAFGEQFLDISEAQGEAKIEPNSLLDDVGWKTIAGIR